MYSWVSHTSTHTAFSFTLPLLCPPLLSLFPSLENLSSVNMKHLQMTSQGLLFRRSTFCVYVNLSLPISLPSFQFAVYRENRFHLFGKGVCLIHICDLRTGRDQAVYSVGNASEAVLCMLLRELHVPECSAGKFIWLGFEIASLGLLAAPPPKRRLQEALPKATGALFSLELGWGTWVPIFSISLSFILLSCKNSL